MIIRLKSGLWQMVRGLPEKTSTFLVSFLLCLAWVIADSHKPSSAAFARKEPNHHAMIAVSNRPFPVVRVRLGDIDLAIPAEWVKTRMVSIREGSSAFVLFPNIDSARLEKLSNVKLPPIISLGFARSASGLPEQNLKRLHQELTKLSPEGDTSYLEWGFRKWKPREYLQITDRNSRPLDQPLLVSCTASYRPNRAPGEQTCRVQFYWTSSVSDRYDFYDSEIPKPDWVSADQEVLKFLHFLDAHQSLSDAKP